MIFLINFKEIRSKKFLIAFTVFYLFFASLSANAADESSNLTVDTTSKAEPKQDNYMYEKENKISEEEYMVEGDGSFPSLFVDWGFSMCGVNKNKELKTGFWGSRFLDFSLCYNLVIPGSHFAIGVGVGFSSRTLSFKKSDEEYYTLVRNKTDRNTESTSAKGALATKDDKDSSYSPSVRGSYLNIYYLDLIFLDVRFFANKLYPKDSFICSIGAKIGTILGSNAEIQYRQDSITKSQTTSDKLNLKDVHWGIQARAAWGRFGFVYEFLISDLFSRDNGPKIGLMQKAGIAIDLF